MNKRLTNLVNRAVKREEELKENPLMQHLNGNLLCSIDVETSGLKAGFHDMLQICILPLDGALNPNQKHTPFILNLKPKRPENADPGAFRVNKLSLADCILKGIDPYSAADMFEEWFFKLQLMDRKKICPLAHNWPFDRGFIIDWLGDETYNQFFDYHSRDTAVIANYLNDRADFANERYPFPKINLTYLSSQLQVENPDAHTAVGDAMTTALCYKKLLSRYQDYLIKPEIQTPSSMPPQLGEILNK
jgi:DNA polymerase III epsilon subunit-like protein